MPEPKEEGKKIDSLECRFKVKSNQRYASLVEYLNAVDDLPYPKTQMFLQALSAFWEPFALKWKGRDEEQVKAAASFAIKSLELHIALLQNQFGIVRAEKVLKKPEINEVPHKEIAKKQEIESKEEDPTFNDEIDILDKWINN